MTPEGAPARIRTDASNAFAHHTLAVRIPAILDGVLQRNGDYSADARERLLALQSGVAQNAALPALAPAGPHALGWLPELARRAGESWLATDWFFAENYFYRQLVERAGFWQSGRDPFRPHKLEEYASPAHAQAFQAALALAGPNALAGHAAEGRIQGLLGAAVFGNRIDLSFAASRERGVQMDPGDLLLDERSAAAVLLARGSGPVHIVIDNAGSELSVDLVLADTLIQALGARVVLQLKVHPAFVSDAIEADVRWFLGSARQSAEPLWAAWGDAASALRRRLRAGLDSGALLLSPHPFWNGPCSLWDLPQDLEHDFASARLVILKGDAHYRRAVGDAVWPAETPFREVTAGFPAPLLALRTLKSDPIVGLAPGQAEALGRTDPSWRVNGKRGVACLGGRF